MKICYPAKQFAIFRLSFGLYLALQFVMLIPRSSEFYSNEGMFSDVTLNWTYGYFPNLLDRISSPGQVEGFLVFLAFASLLFAFGIFRQALGVIIWYGFACLYNRNNLAWSPAMPLLGWLLLASALVPSGEPFTFRKKIEEKTWYMPKTLFWGAWLVLGASYTISGVFKMVSPSWIDGTAIPQTLQWTWSRDWMFTRFVLALPESVLHFITWSVLLIEVFYLPLCIFRVGRIFAWFTMMGIHLGLLLCLDLMDLTLGVMLIHLFTYDVSWFRPQAPNDQPQ